VPATGTEKWVSTSSATNLPPTTLVKQETTLIESSGLEKVKRIQKMKSALEEGLKTTTNEGNATCFSILLELLEDVSFSVDVQFTGIRSVVKEFRSHGALGTLAALILDCWFLQRETRQLQEALDRGETSQVETKVTLLYMYLVKKQNSLPSDLIELKNLRRLIQKAGSVTKTDSKYQTKLEALLDKIMGNDDEWASNPVTSVAAPEMVLSKENAVMVSPGSTKAPASHGILVKQEPSLSNSRNVKDVQRVLEFVDLLQEPGLSKERCLSILRSLHEMIFTNQLQSCRVRRLVIACRNLPSLRDLANQVLTTWFMDREIFQWREALESNKVEQVRSKIAVFCICLDKHEVCLSPELVERLGLLQLVRDTGLLVQTDYTYLKKLQGMLNAVVDVNE